MTTFDLFSSCVNGNLDELRYLLDTVACNDTSPEGYTLLMAATKFGHPHIVEELLMRSTDDINFSNQMGEKAIHFALNKTTTDSKKILFRRLKIINLLTDNGADITKAEYHTVKLMVKLYIAKKTNEPA